MRLTQCLFSSCDERISLSFLSSHIPIYLYLKKKKKKIIFLAMNLAWKSHRNKRDPISHHCLAIYFRTQINVDCVIILKLIVLARLPIYLLLFASQLCDYFIWLTSRNSGIPFCCFSTASQIHWNEDESIESEKWAIESMYSRVTIWCGGDQCRNCSGPKYLLIEIN